MSVFLKRKSDSKKSHSTTISEITKTLQEIFSKSSDYNTEYKREKLLDINLADEFSKDQLDEIKDAHIFVTDYFKTKNMIYHIVQIDRGKNLHLSADFKTAFISPLTDAAKCIPVPVVGSLIAGGAKAGLKYNSDKKRIQRAIKKSGYMPPHDGMIALMTLLFVKVHLAKRKYETTTTFYEHLNKELDIFFSTAKKQMKHNPGPKNLNDFWANVFATYLQDTVLNNTFLGEYFSRNVSFRKILNDDLELLLTTLKNHCSTIPEENTKKVSLNPLGDAYRPPTENIVVLPGPPPASSGPQPGPEITCTLNPTLSPQYLPTNNHHPNSLIMNVVIPDNQGNNPFTLYIPSSNQPILINLLPATKPAVYTPHASTSITYPSILSNSSPQATIPSLNPSTNITLSDRAEKNSLPTHQTITSEEALNPVNHDVTLMTNILPSPSLITTPVPMAYSSMSKAETPQLLSKGSIHPPINLNQLQACVEIMAYIGSVLLAKKNQELYTKQDLLNKKIDQDKKIPKYAMAKPNYSSFFPCGVTAQQINPGISPCLSPAAA